jgi:alpha-galactosidase
MITFQSDQGQIVLGGPVFSINGQTLDSWTLCPEEGPDRWKAAETEGIHLALERHPCPRLGFLRFRWRLEFLGALTRPSADFRITYFSWKGEFSEIEQIELSQFDPVAHSYLPGWTRMTSEEAIPGTAMPGPILRIQGDSLLQFAYEHGHDHPDSFLEFVRTFEGWELKERRLNYLPGQSEPFVSPWFSVGIGTPETLPQNSRSFFLDEICPTPTSRQPLICYNTWNHQERIKYLEGRPYLADMSQERMIAEIEAAHRMGIQVFVIDTGWYQKTGDWEPSLERFPNGLQDIRALLESKGMKLGLWFNPTVAARSSSAWKERPDWQMSWKGEASFHPIWETEESTGFCLCSGWAEWYVEAAVRLHHELGVTYLKWDAVHQLGCDAPGHGHGGEEHTREERAELYGYLSGLRLQWIVEQITTRCPGMVVDFDVTESGRYFGLGFLSAGRFFLVNNGPYFHDFDIPSHHKREPETINVFFNPGPARSRVCRTGARFDPVVPSCLFLVHYLPDGPRLSQENSLASLAVAGGGIWGDLLSLTEEDLDWWGTQLRRLHRAALPASRAFPRVRGFAGSSPEVHEKLDPETGEGLVAIFTVKEGEVQHITQPLSHPPAEVVGADKWEVLPSGRVKIIVNLETNGAKTLFFSR